MWTVPDQTQTHPWPSWSIYSIPELFCSTPELIATPTLLSKHYWSSEHHSQTHLTIPDKPETFLIPWTNLSLHAHLWTWRLSMCNCDQVKPEYLASILIESHSFSLVLIIICPSLLLSYFLLSHSFLCQPCICLALAILLQYSLHILFLPLWLCSDHSFQELVCLWPFPFKYDLNAPIYVL